jgi:hypothetical protein
MQQICSALATDVIDERDTLPPVVFRSSVLSLQDCKKDMPLLGVVRNIVAFGAFVDVGVDTDGALSSLQLCFVFGYVYAPIALRPRWIHFIRCHRHDFTDSGLLHINEIRKSEAFLQVLLFAPPYSCDHTSLILS